MFFRTTMVENYIINFPREVFLTIPHTERKNWTCPAIKARDVQLFYLLVYTSAYPHLDVPQDVHIRQPS